VSFVRRLFGGGRGDGDEEPDAVFPDSDGEPARPSELGPRTYLEFVGGSAAKSYAAVVEEVSSEAWRVSFNYGRIGFPRDWAHKVEGVDEPEARRIYTDLIGEKLRKGYEVRPWPPSLALPSGERVDEPSEEPSPSVRGIYTAAVVGALPTGGASVAGIDLPAGMLLSPMAEGGPRGTAPVLWVTERPVRNVVERWKALASVFTETGLWPLVVDPSIGIDRMPEILMDIPRSTGADPFQLLRRWWHENVSEEDDGVDESVGPFGRAFPGLAARTPGPRPASIERHVHDLQGHLGLVAVERPARVLDAVGWMGPANHDMNPTEQSAILDTWEDRFDAYLVGLGFDTITLAVGRPPKDLASATAVAAEHFAFCSDNIYQGVGSISEYAPLLVGADRWDFWWD
jgi:Domain of unknown function (DUF4253)